MKRTNTNTTQYEAHVERAAELARIADTKQTTYGDAVRVVEAALIERDRAIDEVNATAIAAIDAAHSTFTAALRVEDAAYRAYEDAKADVRAHEESGQ